MRYVLCGIEMFLSYVFSGKSAEFNGVYCFYSWADNSADRGLIWSKFELIRDIVVILVTCKNEEDPLKNKDARVATTQKFDFSNTQGLITPKSEVGSGRNSNSSEMSLLLPRIKKIRIKMKALEWQQH